MRCSNCNNEVPEGKKFCGHCGHKLTLPDAEKFDEEAPTKLVPTEAEDLEEKTRSKPVPSRLDVGASETTAPQPKPSLEEAPVWAAPPKAILKEKSKRRVPLLIWVLFSLIGILIIGVIAINQSSWFSSAVDSPTQVHYIDIPEGPEGGLEFSPDSKTIAVSTYEGKVMLFDVASGNLIRTFIAQSDLVLGHGVLTVAFSPDGKSLASGGSDGRLILWDVQSGQQIEVVEERDDWVNSISWKSDGQLLTAAGSDGAVNTWDVNNIDLLTNHDGSETSWDPAGQKLVIGRNGDIEVWDWSSNKLENSWSAHSDPILAMAWAPRGNMLATGSYSPIVIIWDLQTGKELSSIKANSSEVTHLSFSPDGTMLATGSNDDSNGARIWRIDTGELVHEQDGHSVAWSPDGKLFASGSYYDMVNIWRIK
jgi:WD40 repeat protein